MDKKRENTDTSEENYKPADQITHTARIYRRNITISLLERVWEYFCFAHTIFEFAFISICVIHILIQWRGNYWNNTHIFLLDTTITY